MEKYTRRLDSLGLLLEIVGWLEGHCSVLLLSLCRTVEYSSLYVSERVSDDATAKESMRCFIMVKAHPFRLFVGRRSNTNGCQATSISSCTKLASPWLCCIKIMYFYHSNRDSLEKLRQEFASFVHKLNLWLPSTRDPTNSWKLCTKYLSHTL